MGILLEVLENYKLGNADLQDISVWRLDLENGYTVRSMFSSLCNLVDTPNPGKCVEQANPLKSLIFCFGNCGGIELLLLRS